MNLLHLTSSRFFGGPERQMLGLAQALQGRAKTYFASFLEEGLNQEFLNEVRAQGFMGISLANDTPKLIAARREIINLILENSIDVLLCHGYKAGLIGWFAAQKCRIPAVAVSRGWTGECWKVRRYEQVDRFMLRKMTKVICVSQGQANKVFQAGVNSDQVEVIHNAIGTDRFRTLRPEYREKLLTLFPTGTGQQVELLVGAAGRLSPEKGFDMLVDAAKKILSKCQHVGFVLFGEGSLKDSLTAQIKAAGIQDRFILAGFTKELDSFMSYFDMFVQSSHTEGLPNVLLESLAAGVPVVATDVGGTAEVVNHGQHGWIVEPNDCENLAKQMLRLLENSKLRSEMSQQGRLWVEDQFSFEKQAAAYEALLTPLTDKTEKSHKSPVSGTAS